MKVSVILSAVFCAIAISATLGTSSPTTITDDDVFAASLSGISHLEVQQPHINAFELSRGMGTIAAAAPGASLLFDQPWLPLAHLILNWKTNEDGFFEDRISHLSSISALNNARSTTGRAIHASSIFALPTPTFSELAGKLLLPVDGRILSTFGPSVRPNTTTTVRNTGLTYTVEQVTQAQAVATGHVVYTGKVGGYGNTIIINHGQAFHSVYGHLSVLHVEQGEVVSGGTIIGLTGDIHSEEGSKLYFELRQAGVAFDPLSWLPSSPH
jgi:murein DD-endopeptidase MepM/ murein hydrolase activator NlpD